MQKKLLTMAVAGALAMPAVALAQVTVFGTIDGGIRNQSKAFLAGTAGATDSVLDVTDGLRTTNRWGIRGSEDLGGGLMANFWLEGTYLQGESADALDGFNRKGVVGLSKGGNSVDIGRDYTVNFKANGIMDPMSFTYTGITTTAGATFTAGTRSDDLITAGFRFGTGGIRVDYALGEVVDGTLASMDRVGIGGDFAFGPVTVAAAFSTQETAVNVDTTTTNLGAAYTMGAFTFRGGVNMRDIDQGNEDMQWMLGVQYAFSPTLNGRIGYYNWTTDSAAGVELATRKTAIVALDYILSKRTTAYVAFDRHALTGTAVGSAINGRAVDDGATGLSVGVAHTF
jgi:predicted porin